ncbi:MAG: TonB-dependent receptor [Candidatus Zixiibacteriota bacterium]
MRHAFVLPVVLLLAGATGTRAEVDTLSSRDNPRLLKDSIIVTANRFGATAGQSVWPTGVVQVQQSGVSVSLPELLDGRFGIDTRQYNGVGSVATLSNWGVFNRSMLLLYNGRVVKDYSLGGFNLSDFSPDELERVELVKGPQSVLYGSDAVGGVLNLISRSALADRIDATTRFGAFGLRQYRVDLSRRLGALGVGTSGEYGQADNHRPNAGSKRALFGIRSDYLSRDNHHRWTLSARYFTDSLGVPGPVPDVAYIPAYGSRESYSLYDHQKDENYSVDAGYRFYDRTVGEIQVDLFWEKKNLDYHQLYNYMAAYYVPDPSSPGDSVLTVDSVDVSTRYIYNKRSSGVSARFLREFSHLSVSAGADWLSGYLRATSSDRNVVTSTVGSTSPFGYEYAAYNYWADGQNQLDLWSGLLVQSGSALQLEWSGRLQLVRGRQTQPSYNLGLIYGVTSDLRLKSAYGYAFRLPTIAEQFANEPYTGGNSALHPETSRTLTAGLLWEPVNDRLTIELTVFRQRVDSLIQYRPDPTSFRWVPRNVDRFRSDGLDLSVQASPAETYRVTFGAVVQHADQTLGGDNQFAKAVYVPSMKWRLDFDTDLNSRMAANVNCAYTSDRVNRMGGATKTLHQVYELGVGFSWVVNAHIRLTLSGFDLTDQRRPDQFGFTLTDGDYPSPGRRFVLELRAGLF